MNKRQCDSIFNLLLRLFIHLRMFMIEEVKI